MDSLKLKLLEFSLDHLREIRTGEYQTELKKTYDMLKPKTSKGVATKEILKAKIVFEEFRKMYPGTKRGLDTEFKNFAKHKDWKECLPKLKPALERQIEFRRLEENRRKYDSSVFIPNWKNLQFWISGRMWEVEVKLPKKIITSNRTGQTSIADSIKSLIGGENV